MRANRSQGRQHGIILLEVIVAFSIFALSVTILASTAATSFRHFRRVQDCAEAVKIAENLLIERANVLGDYALDTQGIAAHHYRWRARIMPLTGGLPANSNAESARPVRIVIDILWGARSDSERYTLEAFRLMRQSTLHRNAS